MLGTHYAILKKLVYTKGRGEQSIDIQREDNKKRGGSEEGVAANVWGHHDTGSKRQSGSNLGKGGKGKEWLYRHVVS